MTNKYSDLIADHIRASCFLIGAGVKPSGKQQGYILRRLIRRSLLASLKLGIDITNRQYFVDLVESVSHIYDGVYDEITENKNTIVEYLVSESQKFNKAISVGEKEWSKILG